VYSPCIDLTGISIPTLSFWYHTFGSDINCLYVDVYDGSQWTDAVYQISGSVQTSYTDAWENATVDLSGIVSNSMIIRFRAVRGDGYSGDIAIDDVSVGGFTSIPDVDFSSDFTDVCAGYSVSFNEETCCGANSWNWQFTGGVPGTSNIPNPVINYNITGIYPVSLTSANVYGSNSLTEPAYINVQNLNITPVSEDFESFTVGAPGTFINDWTTWENATFEWRVRTGNTPSYDTGPIGDHTSNGTTGKYLYTESSYCSTGEKAHLFSPCFALDAASIDSLSFWYHMYGANIDTLHLDIYDGAAWHEDVFFLAGQQQISDSAAWLQANIDLSVFAGSTIKIRFRAVRGSGWHGDIAIDDVYISTYAVPYIYCNIDTLDFGIVNISNNLFLQTTIYNGGLVNVDITNIITSGDFQIVGNTTANIATSGFLSLVLDFTPTFQGNHLDSVLICSANDTIKIMLTGEGDLATGIIDESASNIVQLYPNPAGSTLFYNNESGKSGELRFFDMLGKELMKSEIKGKGEIDISNLQQGVYLVHANLMGIEEFFVYRIVVMD
ncbi:MAG: T9SS type A sorting domain-containing protein, partial [Bacteroidota bacterium]|nr:T9SS type A sorting domain-containing protein [Bacteroidota bacterium]